LSTNIIDALRQNDQLTGSLFQAAKELAHRANGHNGIVFMSYSLLAAKCHQSRRTAIRHIHRLLDLGIIKCQRYWQAGGRWGINQYRFVIRWRKPVQMYNGDISSPTLPFPNQEEKTGTLQQLEKGKARVLSWLTEGSELWKLTSG